MTRSGGVFPTQSCAAKTSEALYREENYSLMASNDRGREGEGIGEL